MATKARAARTQPARPVRSSLADLIGDWVRQGTEGFIATEKILLDLAAQQNALALTIVRERLGLFSPTPSKAAIDLAGKSIHNFFQAQQMLLEYLGRQNQIVAEGLKPGLKGSSAENLADVVHRGLDNLVAAQSRFLELFETEATGAVDDFGAGKNFDAGRVTELARKGMREFLHSQKKFLDIVEDELVRKKTETNGHGRKRMDLLETAKKSVDAFVEVQKHMLDLASDQINVNVKLAREVITGDIEKHPSTSLPDIVKKSVDSFVAAQKALVEVASKRRPTEAEAHRVVAVAAG
jgi:hypothetical protein